MLRHLAQRFGKPKIIRMDNGPAFIAKLTKSWSQSEEIEFHYIQLSKPTQNAYVERFNKSFRQGVLNAYLFDNLEQVREIIAEWIENYNYHRQHDALGGISAVQFRQRGAVPFGWQIPLLLSFTFIPTSSANQRENSNEN